MKRHFDNWLIEYVRYASFSEAPERMHFWSGVSALAGALRRRVWIDMAYFKWYANHYIILVAPPGIVSKSTTASIAMGLLREVPGVAFGPDVVTWPALVSAFANSTEEFFVNGDLYPQSALTLEASEFGNLIDPQNRELIDMFITLWDCKEGALKKITKTSGCDEVAAPWINMLACTTPAWIAGYFPEYLIGGGFTSRCLFVYTDAKAKLVAYPHLEVPKGLKDTRRKLIEDLAHIADKVVGPYELTKDAVEWGVKWYERHHKHPPVHLNDDRFGGYLARKQTHLHKLAMVVAAAQRDERYITALDLDHCYNMVSLLERDMPKVFDKIGRSEESIQAERFYKHVQAHGPMPYSLAYNFAHTNFPQLKDFEGIVAGAVKAGHIEQIATAAGLVLRGKTPVQEPPKVEGSLLDQPLVEGGTGGATGTAPAT